MEAEANDDGNMETIGEFKIFKVQVIPGPFENRRKAFENHPEVI